MQTTPHSPQSAKRPLARLLAALVTLSLVAAACGDSTNDERDATAAAAQAIETNDGGVLVKPPDALEDGVAETAPVLADLPAPIDGLEATPVVAFNYFDGSPSSTADFTGQPTVLNFWASNCAACVAEMPEFEEVHLALGDRVDFVGMNVADVSREAAVSLAQQTGVTYSLADDTSTDVFRQFGGFVMPTTVFLNEQGQVAYSWAGVLNGEELTRLINEHILPE